MTVAELIAYLQKQPQDMQVTYRLHSEQKLLEEHEIKIANMPAPRADGWVHNWRPDVPTQLYLMIGY